MYLPLYTHFQCISWLFNHEKVLISKNTAPLLVLKAILCNTVDIKFYISTTQAATRCLRISFYYKRNQKVKDKEPKNPQKRLYLNAYLLLISKCISISRKVGNPRPQQVLKDDLSGKGTAQLTAGKHYAKDMKIGKGQVKF